MSDIFISYARPDRERARELAAALESRGWSVWWDREIPPGRAFDDVIEEALDAARCVVVLWSQTSTASSWVRNEASDAMQRKVLIPALIDSDLKIPLEFRRLQAADLSRWHGEDSLEFQQFCEAIARNVAAPRPPPAQRAAAAAPRPAPPPPAPPPAAAPVTSNAAAPGRRSNARWVWIGGGLLVLVLGGLASLVSEQQERMSPVAPRLADAPLATPAAPTAPAFSMRLAWVDHALMYQGTLSMRAGSNVAQLSVDVIDGQTRRSLGHREVPAYVHADAPGRNVFSAQIPVDGDSTTPGPHVHPLNLVFEEQPNGNWIFVRNCTAPGNCFEAPR